jgi:hypothetical protein
MVVGKDSDAVLCAGPMPPTPPALSSSTGGEGGGKHGGVEETRTASLARAEAQDLSFHGSEYSHDGSEGKSRRSPRHKPSRAHSSASSQPRVRSHQQSWKASMHFTVHVAGCWGPVLSSPPVHASISMNASLIASTSHPS